MADENKSDPGNSGDNVDNDSTGWDAGSAWSGATEDLPDVVELTPDLVEEEAIRGDFMLRWAAILLAVLLACGQMADSRTLVHIRSGLDMQANGFLPAFSDSYSIGAAGQSTENVSWLLDHILGVVWNLGGAVGLTIFKAAIAGLIAWMLSRISVAGLPTWWSSICGVFAMAACSSDFVPITDLMTLLGLVVVLTLLHRNFDGGVSGLIWKLPAVIAVWSNLDPRAWLGVFTFALFSAGRSLSKTNGETFSGPEPGRLWAATTLSLVALLVNPFPVAAGLSVVSTYLLEYPAQRALNPLSEATVTLLDGRTEFYSLLNGDVWGGFEFAYVAGLGVIAFGVVALLVSRDRREVPWAFVLTGFAVVAILTIHELAAAALVAATVASTVGQRWYQRSFPQEYTTKASEVLFSRAGRALTVFSFAFVGFLIVTDRVPTRTGVGSGFTEDFSTTMRALEAQFAKLPDEATVLHTRPEIGDFLIWSGRKSFIDSRARLFGSPGDEGSANASYLNLRKTVLEAASADTQAVIAQAQQSAKQQREAFAPDQSTADASGESHDHDHNHANHADHGEHSAAATPVDTQPLHQMLKEVGLTHVIVRLAPPGSPDYGTFHALGADAASWKLTDLGSSAAVFAYLRNSTDSDQIEEYRPGTIAFGQSPPAELRRFDFARPPGFYEAYLYRTRATIPEDLRIARHHLAIVNSPAAAITAIRAASRLLSSNTQDAEAFYCLGLAYARLDAWEQNVARQTRSRHPSDMRYIQIVGAARQTVTINPRHTAAWNLLYQQYMQKGRVDQAFECLEHVIGEMTPTNGGSTQLQGDEVGHQLQQGKKQLQERLEQIADGVAEFRKLPVPDDPGEAASQQLNFAQQIATAGDVSTCLALLNETEERLKQHAPQDFLRNQLLKGQLLLETGALQESIQLFTQMDAIAREQDKTGLRTVPWQRMAFYSNLCRGFYDEAAQSMVNRLAEARAAAASERIVMGALATLPLVAQIETALKPDVPAVLHWPQPQLIHARSTLHQLPNSMCESLLMLALADLEAGNVEAAKVGFQSIITECGQNPYRPLAAVYLTQLSEDGQEFVAENSCSLWEEWPAAVFEPRVSPTAPTEKPPSDVPAEGADTTSEADGAS